MDFNNLKDELLEKASGLGENAEGLVEQAKEKLSSVVPGEKVDEVVENVKEKVSDTFGSLFNK